MPARSDRYRRIYAVVSRIPKGRVATYGQVAMLAGLPRQARFVGRALHELPAHSDVPWHRVVNAAGKISLRADALGHDELQGHLLQREGVRFVGGTLSLARYRWQPRSRG
ncbi:MAG TPA: MGMT family protein [Polyangia bacterium]|nr:MGMT family protein [Polyangia bacterium]